MEPTQRLAEGRGQGGKDANEESDFSIESEEDSWLKIFHIGFVWSFYPILLLKNIIFEKLYNKSINLISFKKCKGRVLNWLQ